MTRRRKLIVMATIVGLIAKRVMEALEGKARKGKHVRQLLSECREVTG